MLKLQLILNRKKKWKMEKTLCLTYISKFPTFFFLTITLLILCTLEIMEIITNSYGRKSWNECGSEKKALGVIGSLGNPGKLIRRLWLIELQTCQSDNINSL